MKTKIIAAFTALVIMTGVAIMGMGPATAAPYDSFVQTIVDRTNALRAENGLPPVAYDGQIAGVSQEWAEHLYTETQDPMWDSSTVHRHDAGLSLFPGAVYASENVAINADADRIFAAWRDSPGHRANMLSPDVQSIGVGYIQQTAGPYAGQFVAVENFAGYGNQATPVATPADPFVIDASTLSIPAVDGVEYTINGQPAAPGPHTVSGLVGVDARAASGWELAAGSNTHWTFNFTAETPVTPFAPEFNNAAKTYTIPATEGVEYFVAGVPVAAGAYDGAGTVTVNAYAADGYVINAGSATEWTHTYTEEEVAATPVTPAAPTFSDTAFNYTVPTTTGVDYLVNGEFARAGTYTPNTSSVTITAQAQNGFVIAEGATTTWGFTYGASTVYVVPNAPTFSDADRTYLVPSSPGVKYGVNGSIVEAGTYPVDANGATINIDAFAQDGYAMHEGTRSNWTHTFAAVATEPTPTPTTPTEPTPTPTTPTEPTPTPTTPTEPTPTPTTPTEPTPAPTTPADPGTDTPATPGTPPSDDDVVVAPPADPNTDTPATPGTPPSDNDVVVAPPAQDGTAPEQDGTAPVSTPVDAPVGSGVTVSNEANLTEDTKGTIDLATGTSENGLLALTVSGLTPGAEYEIVLHSDPMNLGKFIADANGQITVEVPAELPAGDHKLAVYQNGELVGWEGFNHSLPNTGANAIVLLYGGIVGIAFLLLSGVAYGFYQRRQIVASN